MPIRLLTSGGGTTTIQPTTSASSVTLTIPSVNANVVTTGDTASVTQAMLGSNLAATGPVFHAYVSGSPTIASSTYTTIPFNAEYFDSANCFDTSTYRFTPNVAGYYWFNFNWSSNNIGGSEIFGYIYKNSTGYPTFDLVASSFWAATSSVLLYANGTTDYFYVQMWHNYASARTMNNGTSFMGYLARAA